MSRPTTLYRFFAQDGSLLYAGITSVGPNRWRDHEAHQAWWGLVARTEVQHFDTREAAAEAERTAIQTERPLHNVTHAGVKTPPRFGPTKPYRKRGSGTMVRKSDGRWYVAIRIGGGKYQTTVRDESDALLLLAVLEHRGATASVRERCVGILREGPDFRP